MESTIDSMCRCCAAEGIFKDIKTSYHWMGEEEVYGDMLRECFDVKLASIDQGGICEVCITQLRNAANFKKQVVHTERKFKRHLDSRSFKPTEVKEELSGDNANSSDDDHVGGADSEDDEDYVPEFEIPIKTESPEESKSRKRAAKASASTSRAKKSRAADEDKSSGPLKKCVKKKKTIIIKLGEENAQLQLVSKNYDELKKHQVNIRTILACSNATPIRKYAGVGYMCCFCVREFPEPGQLKSHTLRNHDNSELSCFIAPQTMSGFVVKLDITDLQCSLCKSPFTTLEDLTYHLTNTHNKVYHADIKSHIIPFRFSDTFRCVSCASQFSNFKVLLEHMNEHFKNHICDICGKGFVNKSKFQTHMYTHNKGEFSCSLCDKVFDTRVKWRAHFRAAHVLMNKRSKCGYCGERFNDYAKKQEHEVEKHGATRVVLHCHACEKIFGNQRALNVHTKKYHLMERKVPK